MEFVYKIWIRDMHEKIWMKNMYGTRETEECKLSDHFSY